LESSFLPVGFRVGVCKGMSKSRREDLKYWADKLAYAETLYGERAESMKKVCRMMIDLYLDFANQENATIHSN